MYEKVVLEWSGDGGAFDFHYIKDDGGQKIDCDFLRLMLSEIETARVAARAISFRIPFINLVYSVPPE